MDRHKSKFRTYRWINRLLPKQFKDGEFMSGILSVLAIMIKEVIFFVSYVKNKAFPQPLSNEEEEKYIQEMLKGNKEARNKLIEHNRRLPNLLKVGEFMSGILSVLAIMIKEVIFFVSYVKNKAFPQPLSNEEEEKYIQEMLKGNKEARNKLIEHNLRLVAHIVKKFDNTGEDTEDLISIGTIGLIKGVETYNPNRKAKLATYAARCIENEILMHLRSLRKVRKDISIYEPIGQDKEGNEINFMDILEAENEDIIEFIQLNMEIENMEKYFAILDSREKEVIVYRYGLNNYPEMTQREIAKRLNISRSYVSRIEKRALMKVFREYYRKEKHRFK